MNSTCINAAMLYTPNKVYIACWLLCTVSLPLIDFDCYNRDSRQSVSDSVKGDNQDRAENIGYL